MNQSFRCYRVQVVLIILLTIFPVLIAVVFSHIVDQYGSDRLKVQKGINGKYDGFLLGSSHANSLSIEHISRRLGVNISKQNSEGSDLFEIMYQIKSIKKKKSAQKIFFIALSPFSFHYDNNSYIKHGKQMRAEKRVRLYAIYRNYMNLINNDWQNLLYAFFFPVKSFDDLEKYFNLNTFSQLKDAEVSKHNFPKDNSAKLKKRFMGDVAIKEYQNKISVEKNKCDPLIKADQLDAHAMKRVNNVFVEDLIPNMSSNANYDIPVRSLSMFENLLNAYPNDIFIVYIPPFWDKYYRDIPKEIMISFQHSVKTLSDISNVYLYDYSSYEFVAKNPCYFINSDHLNKEGGRIFTNHFINDLNKLEFVANYKRNNPKM